MAKVPIRQNDDVAADVRELSLSSSSRTTGTAEAKAVAPGIVTETTVARPSIEARASTTGAVVDATAKDARAVGGATETAAATGGTSTGEPGVAGVARTTPKGDLSCGDALLYFFAWQWFCVYRRWERGDVVHCKGLERLPRGSPQRTALRAREKKSVAMKNSS